MCGEHSKVYVKRVWEVIPEPSSILLKRVLFGFEITGSGETGLSPPSYSNVCSSASLVAKHRHYIHYP